VVGRRASACQRRDEIDIDQVIYLQYPFLGFSKCAHNAWNTHHWYTRIALKVNGILLHDTGRLLVLTVIDDV
jgi:hypothetical protein